MDKRIIRTKRAIRSAFLELRKEQPGDPFWEKLEQRYKDQNL